jgi:thiamine-phosphate pyrophosphorylase
MAPGEEPLGLYLIVEVADAAGAVARARAGLDAASVRAVLLAPATGTALTADTARAALELVQKAGVAALIEDDDALARTLGADGVHLSWSSDIERRYRRARETLGGGAIVGVDAGTSRHDAMTLGEAGADYVAFSIGDGDPAAARAARLDLCAWWSEIFEVPCVAFDCVDAADACDLAETGADFLAMRLASGTTPAEVAERVGMVARALAGREGVS